MNRFLLFAFFISAFALASSCGGTPAQQSGVGRECAGNDDCADDQSCLDFAGGYCGIDACLEDSDCPGGSACVVHTDGSNYCFLICDDKVDCNGDRSADNESNCSSNITFVEGKADDSKACVPPSSG